ncbi:MAG: FxsA family protein [Pseudomonadota bacterium]
MSPFAVLFIALITVPLIEIYLLISVGRVIGAGSTIAVVILTAILGAWLLRIQGLQTVTRIQQSTAAGKLPAQELVEGLILLITGALLLTPGFFTDAVGFALLIPAFRGLCAKKLIASGVYRAQTHFHGDPSANPRGPRTFEGEYYDPEADSLTNKTTRDD